MLKVETSIRSKRTYTHVRGWEKYKDAPDRDSNPGPLNL